ncbi:hypothetical protein POX_d04947 [Penicillium oxalicum]|uniref:hypothetical protein n=1 Tax=Penicillium oxalicum TaxID=69781 RepID=UPI0020B660CC|nr:hypothetical protein POX_d04947 [Penicillium oxalicum]KAI2789456.1 hypothetical protein POX_d04947 [Penicillium oxalicum]
MVIKKPLDPEEARSIHRCALRYAQDRRKTLYRLRECRYNLLHETVDPGTLRRNIQSIAFGKTQLNFQRDAPSEVQELHVPVIRDVFPDPDIHMEAKEIWENNELHECYLRTWKSIQSVLLEIDDRLKCYGFVKEEKMKMVAMLEMLVVQVGRLREALVGLIIVDRFADEMDEIATSKDRQWSSNPELWRIWSRLQRDLKCGCIACTPLAPKASDNPVFVMPYLPLIAGSIFTEGGLSMGMRPWSGCDQMVQSLETVSVPDGEITQN